MIREISDGFLSVRITKDDLNKEFTIERGYSGSDYSKLERYPFVGWETWEEIMPVAEFYLENLKNNPYERRKALAKSFDRSVQTPEQATESAIRMLESLRSRGVLLKAPAKRS